MLCLLPALPALGKDVLPGLIMTLEFPSNNKESKFTQRLSYENPIDTVVLVRLNCYYFAAGASDSINVYDLSFEEIRLNKGAGYVDLPFSKALSTHKMHADFFEVVRKFRMVPAGNYRTQVQFYSPKENHLLLFEKTIEQFADADLSYSTGLRDKMNAAIALPKSAKQKGQNSLSGRPDKNHDGEALAAEKKLKRNLRPVKGLEMRSSVAEGKKYSEAYYKGFYLGRYEMASVKELNERAEKESEKLNDNSSALVSNELEGFTGVGAQLKELNTKKDKQTRVKGTVDVSTYRATTQDPQSAIEQNYTEFLVNTDVELMGMPFNVEGFYTTQDQNRKAKASYFRFHYDVTAAKSKLQDAINAYKSKLSETGGKGQGLESIYGSYAKNLETQKSSLLNKMAREYEVDPTAITKSGGNVDKLLSEEDLTPSGSSNDTGKVAKALARKQKLQKDKKDIAERYQKILELQQKAEKYYKLLDNYRTRTHLDSAVNYKKIAGLDNKDASYKDMSQAAIGILPEGKAKSFATGLTSFDAGIINKYESDYTMAGQTMKGVSLGYDLGVCKTGITVGSTEYISREGNVDHYSSMLLRVDNKGRKNHKVGVIASMTTPSNAMTVDENFIGQHSIRYPGFNRPTYIGSIVYEGKIGKQLNIQSELASSFKKDQATKFDMAHSALTNTIDYAIPKTTVNINGTWEHLGHSFENNALPYIRSGTERYTLGTGMDLFRSFLSLKIDYNYLVQQNLSSTGYNRRWGFDARTHSRRYPNVSLSYKPFATFRSLSDTLQIAQRPVQGEVWTARVSYQIKRKQTVHRFTLTYNRNSSTSDTISYTSSMAQAGYMYTVPGLSLNVSLSKIGMPSGFTDSTGATSSYVSNISISKTIGKYVTVMLGPDLAVCRWGMQRISGTAGITFKFPNKPIMLRGMFRYSSYKLNETAVPLELYAGQFGVNWQFKAEKKNKVSLK